MISDKLREQGQGERLLKEALRRIERTVVDKETLKKREKGRIVERYIRMKIGQEKARRSASREVKHNVAAVNRESSKPVVQQYSALLKTQPYVTPGGPQSQ